MKVISFVGARPQFIKLAPIDHRFKESDIQHIIVHSGQHYDKEMSEIFFKELNIEQPHYNLGVGSDSHARQTAKMMELFEEVVIAEKPDVILLYGDTNTTVAGSIVSSKLLIPVVHIEAGLRSYNKRNPEEINRVITDSISDMLLVPSKRYAEILRHEGKEYVLSNGNLWNEDDQILDLPVVVNVGDVMYDTILYVLQNVKEDEILKKIGVLPGEYIYVTLHRPYNVDERERLSSIISALSHIAKDIPVIFAVHPRTHRRIQEFGLDVRYIRMIKPQPFSHSIVLQKHAKLIITDSGGITKESFILGTRALIVRDEVEWVETVETGFHKLVSPTDIEKKFLALMSEKKPEILINPYGDGKASDRIEKLLPMLVDAYPY